MSRNFRDAVVIARSLGLSYLWVDSLCIIQNWREDWEEQSSKMAEIFGNAYITIAATSAENGHGGCLFDRQCAKRIKPLGREERLQYARIQSSEAASLEASPINERGWVLQEMALSRRTVHFAKDQLFWQCRTVLQSEDGLVCEPRGSVFLDLSTPEFRRRSWWSWVEGYSKRTLTDPTDYFAAFAGVTVAFQKASFWAPKAGLWDGDIYFGLLWCAQKEDRRSPEASTPPTSNEGPSWSWMSQRRPVRAIVHRNAKRWKDHDEQLNKVAEILEHEIYAPWSGPELISPVLEGRIMMRARLKEVHICPDHRDQEMLSRRGSSYSYHAFADAYLFIWIERPRQVFPIFGLPPEIPWIGACSIDSRPRPARSRVLCLELSVYGPCQSNIAKSATDDGGLYHRCSEYGHCQRDILIIEAIEGAPGQYRKIGAGDMVANLGTNRGIHPHHDFFHDATRQDLVLV